MSKWKSTKETGLYDPQAPNKKAEVIMNKPREWIELRPRWENGNFAGYNQTDGTHYYDTAEMKYRFVPESAYDAVCAENERLKGDHFHKDYLAACHRADTAEKERDQAKEAFEIVKNQMVLALNKRIDAEAARGELKAALEKITEPQYGLELNDSAEMKLEYWSERCIQIQQIARKALQAHS